MGNLRVVTSGLSADDQVLLTNVKDLLPGMPVAPIPGMWQGRPTGEALRRC